VTHRPPTALVWFGVLGGALAWGTQFIAGLAFTWAQCNAPPGRWQLPVRTWQSALAIGGVIVGLASVAVCVRLYRATRDVEVGDGGDEVAAIERRGEGTPPPVGRVNFLATTGLLVNTLALAIMIMTAIGAPLLRLCQQS
jgi:hypothetical protein